MCKLILFFSICNLLIFDILTNPVIIRTGIINNGANFEDATNSAAAVQKGVTNIESNEGFNKLYDKKLLDSALNSRYGEQSNVLNNHADAVHFNKGIVSNNNGAEGSKLEDNVSHKKGHHKNGFHNSYHKDEVGSNSSFFDDGESEGGQRVYKNNQGSYANAQEDNKRGDHSDATSYNNQRGGQGHYINGQNYVNDINAQQNHNRKNYYDDRRDESQRNVGRRYGDEKNYNEERISDHPHYSDHSRMESPRRRITIFEDPRYDVPLNKYNDGYIELDVRPSRHNEYRRQPLDYY